MKISYACYWNMSAGDGVADKIRTQLGRWREAGHDAELFFLTPRGAAEDAESTGQFEHPFPFSTVVDRVRATWRLAAAVRRRRADLVYLRYDLFAPPLLRAFGDSALVVELNSNVGAELAARSHNAARYERLQRRVLLRRLDGAVAVTHELAQELRRARPDLPIAVISNGIELGPERPPTRGAPSPPRLVYVGEGVYWQGIDKIHELARAFPAWEFDLVGVASDGAPPNVTSHGFLAHEAYTPILARADIGLGTLALHRKHMDEACPLKVRRYLEFGLPVVLGYTDTDLSGREPPPWWNLQLPNDETNVRDNLAEIAAFVDSAAGRRVERSEVEPLVSAAAKETARLEFFRRVRR